MNLDSWITGNYGYDHPDNNNPIIDCPDCGAEIDDDSEGGASCPYCGWEEIDDE